MPVAVINIVREFADDMKKLYGEHLNRVMLYGSYARGDYTKSSDIDVMILVSLPEDEIKKTSDAVADCAFDYLMKYDVDISPIVKNTQQFDYWADTLPFYKNICDEGVNLSA